MFRKSTLNRWFGLVRNYGLRWVENLPQPQIRETNEQLKQVRYMQLPNNKLPTMMIDCTLLTNGFPASLSLVGILP